MVNVVAYVKTETTTENAATGIYKTKESEALTTKPKEAELLTFQQPILRQIRELAETKNATKLFNLNYNNMKTILDKINKADEIQAKKVELGKHEVELALVDDIKKYTTELNKLFTEASNTEDKLDNLTKQLFPLLNSADVLVKKIKDVQDKSSSAQIKFVQAIKELGFNPSESKENIALFDIKDSIATRAERIKGILSNFK